MTMALIYWILMLLWLVLGAWGSYSWATAKENWRPLGGHVLLFLLLLILGWSVFGAPVKT